MLSSHDMKRLVGIFRMQAGEVLTGLTATLHIAVPDFSATITSALPSISAGVQQTAAASAPLVTTPMSTSVAIAAAAATPVLSGGGMERTLRACVASGDYTSLLMHFAATCMVGPLWEEVSRGH